MLNALLFDLDGTLIDSHIAIAGAANVIRVQRGLPALPHETLRAASLITTAELLFVAFGLRPSDPEYHDIQHAYLQEYCRSIQSSQPHLFPGIDTVLAMINAHQLPWGIVTNKMRGPTLRFLEADSPLRPGMQTLVCYDDTPNPKPAPDPILQALYELGNPTQCWYVGDQPIDVIAAHAAGISVVAANWTHSQYSQPNWSLNPPDHICDTVEELQQWIQHMLTSPSLSLSSSQK